MSFVIVKEEKLIIQKFSGKLTYENWLKSAETIWQNPDYDRLFRGIIDFRKADIKMKVNEVKSIVKLLTQESDKAMRSDTVIIIDGTVAAAFASIFAYSMKQLISTKIVTTPEGAAAKLNVDESVFELLEGSNAVTLVSD